jgi:hypothetical protein
MTMQEFPLSQSPRTQGMGAEAGPDQVEELFNDGFTELAYQQFGKAYPDLMKDVVTFKILRTDPNTGSGVGVFIVNRNQDVVYVPAIVSNNEVKPLDLFFSKSRNHFYPMSPDWLDHASQGPSPELGQPVKPPKTLATDVDIRNLVVPPTTGRYSYASDGSSWMLPELLARAPAAVKTAMSRVLAKNANVRRMAVETYGKEVLAMALAIPKTAAIHELRQQHSPYKQKSDEPQLTVVDENTTAAKLRELFGDHAGVIYQTLRLKGFYAKDERKQHGAVVQMTDKVQDLIEPETSGLYRVFLTDGSSPTVFVLCNPVHLCDTWGSHPYELKNRTQNHAHGHGNTSDAYPPSARARRSRSWLVYFKDGRYAIMTDLLAQPVVATHGEVARWLGDGDGLKSGDQGFFLSSTGIDYRGTDARYFDQLSHRGERIEAWADGTKIVVDPTLHGKTIIYPAGQNAVHLPSTYRFHRVHGRVSPEDFYLSPQHVLRHAERTLKTAGARPISVERASAGWKIDGQGFTSRAASLKEAALRYGIKVEDAQALLKQADEQGGVRAWAVDQATLQKLAQPAGGPPGAAPPGGPPAPGAPPGMDPSMMGGVDPMTGQPLGMGPPQPPQPTSIELAAAEMMQQLQSQQSSLQQQMTLLQQVAARAQQIEQSGAGVMAAPAAASALFAPPPPPPPVPGAPADPNAAQPPDAAGAPPGAPPGAPGADQQMIDPMTGQPLPPPMARLNPNQQLTADNIEQGVNPQFLDSAAQLADQNVFDAAAVSSLAQNPGVLEQTQTYTPVLDKALDNLGRLLLLFYMKEDDIKQSIGQEDYQATEQKLRDVFRGMGESLTKIERLAQRPLYQDMPTQ